MKFLLIYPASRKYELASKKFFSTGAFLPPLGILYLAKMLEINGHDIEVLDCTAEDISENKLKEKILSSDAVGMTIFSDPAAMNNSIMISNLVKERDPAVPLLIGGPHCSFLPEQSLLSHHADICVRGEGELVIAPIAEAIEGKRELSTIPGIYYKEDNKIRKTEPAKQIDDLDALPFPDRHLVNKYEYGFMQGVKIAKGKATSLLASRGCPYHCKFCGLHSHIPGYQRRSVNNVTKEIQEIVDEGYTTLAFVDDNFLFQQKEVEKIMDFIIQKDMNVRLWIEEARVDSANRILFQKMRDAGVEILSFGIESGNQDVLDFYNKRITLTQIRDAVNLGKEMGFFINASFILGAPIETKKHIKNTIKFAKSLPLDSVEFYNLGYGFGAPLWKEAVAEGKIQPDEFFIDADSRRGLSNFTEEELINYTMKASNSYYLNPKLWMRELFYAFANKDFRFLKLGLKLLTGS